MYTQQLVCIKCDYIECDYKEVRVHHIGYDPHEIPSRNLHLGTQNLEPRSTLRYSNIVTKNISRHKVCSPCQQQQAPNTLHTILS